jgi:hypothetical protein
MQQYNIYVSIFMGYDTSAEGSQFATERASGDGAKGRFDLR